MKKLAASALVLTLVCSGAFGFLERTAPAREIARDSLDALKAIAPRNATAQGYVSTCVSFIAGALRLEGRGDVPEVQVRGSWYAAAGRCLRLASSACDALAPAAIESCTRLRAYDRR